MRYFFELSFNGKNYHGWQMQPNAISVQETLNNALSQMLRKPINILGAGRTDTGVHAAQMFAHFDIDTDLDGDAFVYKLNAFLPDDIVVKQLFLVSDTAHARFDAVKRTYEYRIWLGRNPFNLDTSYQIYQSKIDVKKMNEAAALLLKTTNFKCFSKSKTDVKTYNCKIEEANWILEDESLIFRITADRFLRNMVRAIVGTLLDVGIGKKTKKDVVGILESKDRSRAGVSVPPQALFLTRVKYPASILKN